MKTKPIFLLFSISLVALCMLTCGCTAQDGSSNTDTAAATTTTTPDENFNPEDMPEGDQPGGMGGGMDLASAAETLGVTEDELSAALGMGEEGGEPMDLESAAATLGVTVEELQEALGMGDLPEGGGPGGERPEGEMPDGTPPGEAPA